MFRNNINNTTYTSSVGDTFSSIDGGDKLSVTERKVGILFSEKFKDGLNSSRTPNTSNPIMILEDVSGAEDYPNFHSKKTLLKLMASSSLQDSLGLLSPIPHVKVEKQLLCQEKPSAMN